METKLRQLVDDISESNSVDRFLLYRGKQILFFSGH